MPSTNVPSTNVPSKSLKDDGARLEWLRRAYYGVDGRWFLKVRERYGPEIAQVVDEEVMTSLARLHVRNWLQLTGNERIEDCTMLGSFVCDVFDVLYGSWTDAFEVALSEPDLWEMRHIRCTIFDMGVAAGYADDPVPGELPGCKGIVALYRGWCAAAGDFAVEQIPLAGGKHGVACRYVFTRGAGDDTG